jgi:hypothetical protein
MLKVPIYFGSKGHKIQWIGGGASWPYWGGKEHEVIDLDEEINKEYPEVNIRIEILFNEYFILNEDQMMYQLTKSISKNDRLSLLFPDEELNLKHIKTSDGSSLGIFINKLGSLRD